MHPKTEARTYSQNNAPWQPGCPCSRSRDTLASAFSQDGSLTQADSCLTHASEHDLVAQTVMRVDGMTKKELLLDAAKEVFGECGYTDTTFKKISERAGVAFGLLTHHFGTKENLFLITGLEVLASLHERLKAAMAGESNGLNAVMGFCREYLAFSVEPKSHFMVLVRCSPYSDLKASENKESIRDGFRALLQDLEAALRQGMEDGTVREVPAKETSAAILSTLVGAVRTELLTGYAPPNFYPEVLVFIERSLKRSRDCQGPDRCAHAIY